MYRIAFVYPKNNTYLQGNHDVALYRNFFIEAMQKTKRIDYHLVPVEGFIDVSSLTAFAAVIFWSCVPSILDVRNVNKLKRVKCVYGQDPIDLNESWYQKYREYEFNFVFFHAMKKAYPRLCKFPEDIDYECIVPGVDPHYFPNDEFVTRHKDKIVCMGSYGNSDTPLRSLMVASPQVEYVGVDAGYVGNRFGKLLQQYRAACTSMTNFIVPKYVELPMGGCLTFMGANDTNGIEELGFVDGESSIYVTVENYRQKFDEYLSTVDDPKWGRIAAAGRAHVMKTWSNETQVNKLIDAIERYL